MRTTAFDCVKMKRRAALRIHERLRDLTVEQQIEYWRRRNEEFLGKRRRPRDKRDAPPASPPSTRR